MDGYITQLIFVYEIQFWIGFLALLLPYVYIRALIFD